MAVRPRYPVPAAFDAACAFVEIKATPLGEIEAAGNEHLFVVSDRVHAVFADGAHEALCKDAVERGDEVVRLDAHVEEASQHVEDVVGVDRGEDEVSGGERS